MNGKNSLKMYQDKGRQLPKLLSIVEFSVFLQSAIHKRDCTKKSRV